MRSLPEFQSGFAAALFDGDAGRLLALCAGSPEQAQRGLAAYRRSVLGNLTGAVIATYPVIGAIVGADFLAAAARHYAAERPSRSGNLDDFGADFADFLAGYAPAAGLPYLADTARLEWQVQWVHDAADPPPQDLRLLAATPAEDWGRLHFTLDPAHAIFAADWPVVRIWEVNQPGHDGDFAVDFDTPQIALIHRRVAGISVSAITAAEHALLQGLASGASLDAALGAALVLDAQLDLARLLERHIVSGLLLQAHAEDSP